MKTYIPALRFHFATGLYDRVGRWTTRETVFKRVLVERLAARGEERILDLGCRTGKGFSTVLGTLAIYSGWTTSSPGG